MKVMIIVQNIYEDNNREDNKDDDDDSCSNNDSGDDKDDNDDDDDDDYLILLYFRGTWISRKFSRHISRVFNFAIAEKNCVCREFNFAKLTIKWLYFFFFTKILR